MSVDFVRIVDSIHREKNIPKDILYEGIQSALVTAAKKHYPDAESISIVIDPDTGRILATKDGIKLDLAELGRIPAQTAKQVIIQKIREAERDSLFDEFEEQRGDLVTGTIQRNEGGIVTANLGKTDALLPKGEQIPGENYNPGDRVRAVILDVRKHGQRVKIILSRTHPDFVRRLFELEIPEIADQIIAIRGLAREAGYRSKVAVSSIDSKVDAVGACVGVRGTRIKNIVDELHGERIDIVRWNESLQVLIPNALQPAEIDEVMLCQLLGRAIVLVREDQLSLAIGRRGQNVRLASKLVGWDIEIMTSDELDEVIEKAVGLFTKIDPVDQELAERLVEQGILSYDDLSVMEIDALVNTIDGLTEEQANEIVAQADKLAEALGDEAPRRGKRSHGHEPAASAESAAVVTVADDQERESNTDSEAPPAVLAATSQTERQTATEDELKVEEEEEGDGDGDGENDPETDPDADSNGLGLHDFDLASEIARPSAHEVTFAPPDADPMEDVLTMALDAEAEIDSQADASSAEGEVAAPDEPGSGSDPS